MTWSTLESHGIIKLEIPQKAFICIFKLSILKKNLESKKVKLGLDSNLIIFAISESSGLQHGHGSGSLLTTSGAWSMLISCELICFHYCTFSANVNPDPWLYTCQGTIVYSNKQVFGKKKVRGWLV